jgi:FMN phosphatase YigB (HAD superfamily)
VSIKSINQAIKSKKLLFFTIAGLILASIITIALIATSQFQRETTDRKLVIIWDLGDVCLQTNRKKATPIVGLSNSIARFLAYKVLKRGFDPADTQQIMFEFMDFRRGNPPHTAAKHRNLPLPLDMREIMKGEKTATEMVESVCEDCDLQADYFVKYHNSDNSGREMVKGALRCLLPENLVKIQEVNPQVLELVRACKQTGNCRLLILSNWDKESCDQLIANKPELFENFERENIIFSGKTGFMKPEPEIYNYVTDKFNLDPADCILIDDQPENIAGAQAAGWKNSFVHTDAESTKAELLKLDVISDPETATNSKQAATVN